MQPSVNPFGATSLKWLFLLALGLEFVALDPHPGSCCPQEE